ncbi:Uncharacterised protein [Mycobacterium tuberculosis]|nr:Uncharacterised protein [Mycobacterium tuberculosis]
MTTAATSSTMPVCTTRCAPRLFASRPAYPPDRNAPAASGRIATLICSGSVPCTPSRNSGRTNSSPSSPTLMRAEARLPRRKFGMRNSSRSSITGRPAAARDRSTATSAAISSAPSARITGTGDTAVSGQAIPATANGRVGVHQP